MCVRIPVPDLALVLRSHHLEKHLHLEHQCSSTSRSQGLRVNFCLLIEFTYLLIMFACSKFVPLASRRSPNPALLLSGISHYDRMITDQDQSNASCSHVQRDAPVKPDHQLGKREVGSRGSPRPLPTPQSAGHGFTDSPSHE